MRRLSLLVLLCSLASATVYTVKPSGGNFTTIQACSNTAVAGDTCTIYAGTYVGWTQNTNGSAGHPITFIANTGDTVNVSSGATISSRSYIVISGLNFTQTTGIAITGDNTTAHNVITHNTFKTQVLEIPSGGASTGSDNVISYNVADLSTHSDNTPGFDVYGDRNIFDHNEIKNGEGDCHDLGGQNVVVRYTTCHDINGASGEHIDFLQVIGGVSPTLTFSLIEGNTMQHCYNDGGNCHSMLIRNGASGTSDTVIYRYNYTQNIDGSGPGYGGGSGENVPNGTIYNNTFNFSSLESQNGGCPEIWDSPVAPNAQVLNNICYNTTTGGWSPTGSPSSGLFGNGNIAYTTGYSGSWNAPYSAESTYATLKNVNPLFANYPTDGTLQASSPARNAGVALTTTNGSGSTSTTLILTNSHFFQPGWGSTDTPVNGDCIRVGASTTTCITAINYSTNTLTVSPAISWTNGQSVYLYSDSSGIVRQPSGNPDIGAFPYSSSPASIGSTLSTGSQYKGGEFN